MSFSVGYNFIAKDKFSAVALAMKKSIDKISKSADKARKKSLKLALSMHQVQRRMQSAGNSMLSTGKKLTRSLTLPIVALGVAVLGAAGMIEKIETGFVGMLGSAKKAKALVKELTDFTAKTPFQLGDVAGAAKQLLAAGVPVDKIKDKLQFLGNISAAANVPLGDMAAIFSKSKNKGKAMTEELLQLSDRGIPIIDVLSRGLGVSKNKVFELASQGKISFSILEKAMIQMSKKGEFANRAMVLQSKTLFGIISTLKDNFILAAAAMGNIFLPMAKKVGLLIIKVTQAVMRWVNRNKTLVKIIGTILAVMALIGPIMVAVGVAILANSFLLKGFIFLLKMLAGKSLIAVGILKIFAAGSWLLAGAIKGVAFAFGILTSPIGITIAVIAGIIFAILKFTGVWDVMMKKISDVGIIQAAKDMFTAMGNAIGNAMDKVKSFLGFGSSDINVNSRQEISGGAANPVVDGRKDTFQGSMNISIADKGKNVESVKTSSFGALDLGVSGIGG